MDRLGDERLDGLLVYAALASAVANMLMALAMVVMALAAGGWLGKDSPPPPPPPPPPATEPVDPAPPPLAAQSRSRSRADMTVVVAIDTTSSVSDRFRAYARDSIADAIPRLVADGRGRIDIYVRKIDHSSGADSAALAAYHIDAIRMCANDNPFDQKCRNEHEASLARARAQARAIARRIRELPLPRGRAGTVVRGAFAAAGQIFTTAKGDKWMVVASDLRPSNSAPPRPRIALKGVRVAVLFSCRQPIAVCQRRQEQWNAELRSYGVVAPITFLSSQQGHLLFRR